MFNVFAVFIGGGLGSLCRYGLGSALPMEVFPWGTLVANALACAVLGAVLGTNEEQAWAVEWRLLLGTGFCGGFSTFSTFVSEAERLPRSMGEIWAVGYVALSLVSGWLAFCLGWWCSRQWQA